MPKQTGLLAAIAILGGLSWFTHDVSPTLTHEDPGRDLHAAWRTLEGELPYRDFQWVYGLLMPFYYAACLKILGVSIGAMQLGYTLLQATGSLVTFLTARRLFGWPLAIPAAIFHFFLTSMYHTYNHSGAVVLLAILIHWLVVSRDTELTPGKTLQVVALLSGVYAMKATMGIACTFTMVAFLILTRFRGQTGGREFRLAATVILIAPFLLTQIPRLLLMTSQPHDRWVMCNTFGPGPLKIPHSFSWKFMTFVPAAVLKADWEYAMKREHILYFLLLACGAGTCLWTSFHAIRLWRRKPAPFPVLPLLAPIVLFSLGHEFLLGTFNPATLGYHLAGYFSLFLVGTVHSVSRNRKCLWIRPAFVALFGSLALFLASRTAYALKHGQRGLYWDHPRGRVWLTDSPYARTLVAVPLRLECLSAPGERVAVIPRGQLYLFMAGRPSATWMDEMNVQFLQGQDAEEDRILASLAVTRLVLLTNFARHGNAPGNNMGDDYGTRVLAAVLESSRELERAPAGPLLTFGPGRPFNFNDHQVRFLVRSWDGPR